MRVIRNAEDLRGFEFHESPDPDYESDDSGNDSNEWSPPEDFISDLDSEAEPDEEIHEDLIEDNSA